MAAPVLYNLRRRVLRGGDTAASVAEPRDGDASALHFGGYLADRLVACASFYSAPSPLEISAVAYQLRFMAIDFDVQGRGYGAELLESAFATLRELGAEEVWAKARDTALGFYLATGWRKVEGSEHMSAETNLPHSVVVTSLVDPAR